MPHDERFPWTRREAIGAGLAAIAAAATGSTSAAQTAATDAAPLPKPAPTGRSRALRLAHLTDIHVEPERQAEAGLVSCLHHVQSQSDKPELILTGGDHVMDAFDQKEPRRALLGDLWQRTMKRDSSTPVRSCIGNHDIWGWGSAHSGCKGDEPSFGKSFSLDLLGLSRRFSSFDQAGWHFILLDSVQRKGDGYFAEIDPEQWDWLEKDLAAKPAEVPTVVLSHVPILSITPYALSERRKGDSLSVPVDLMHADGLRLHHLLRGRNVRLCLSGHIHLLDRCEMDGVTYLCDGAVSGNWWKGPHKGLAEGYGLVDLYTDGSFDHRYVPFGWVAAKA